MNKKTQFLFAFLLSFSVIKNSYANLFNITATRSSNGQTASAGFNSAEEAIDYFKGQNLNSIFGTNVDNEAIAINMNYRGLGANLSYNGTNALTLNIDGIVTNKVFTGGNRDASVELLKDYLKSDGGNLINEINKRLAAISPSDPIAGNPASLMSQMVNDDFDLAFVDSLHDNGAVDKNGKKIGNEMGAGVKYENYNVSGINSQVVALSPFSWRRNINNSDVKLLLKIPVFKMVNTESAKSYQASSAVGFHVPLYKDYWSIAPLASIGAGGSQDLASGAMMSGFSVTNKLKYKTDRGFGFHLGTLFGRYQTEKVRVNGYSFNPNITNNILKNSFVVILPVGLMQDYAVDLSATNTRFYGTSLYIQNAMDYGIGFVKTNKTTNNEARLDLKYYSYNSSNIASIGNGSRRVNGVSANLRFQY